MAIANTVKPYVNADGLAHKYPQAEMLLGKAGEWNQFGNVHVTEIKWDYTLLALGTSSTNPYVLDFDAVIPASAVVNYVEFYTTTAWAGASGTYNVGLVKRSDQSTIIDADGLVAAITVATLDTISTYRVILADSNVGTATYGGTLLDSTIGSDDALVCVNWDTTVPSAGAGSIRIGWTYPSVT